MNTSTPSNAGERPLGRIERAIILNMLHGMKVDMQTKKVHLPSSFWDIGTIMARPSATASELKEAFEAFRLDFNWIEEGRLGRLYSEFFAAIDELLKGSDLNKRKSKKSKVDLDDESGERRSD